MILVLEMYKKDMKCSITLFQIVPNLSNYDSSPRNVHKGYEILGNVPLHFSNCTKLIKL